MSPAMAWRRFRLKHDWPLSFPATMAVGAMMAPVIALAALGLIDLVMGLGHAVVFAIGGV